MPWDQNPVPFGIPGSKTFHGYLLPTEQSPSAPSLAFEIKNNLIYPKTWSLEEGPKTLMSLTPPPRALSLQAPGYTTNCL